MTWAKITDAAELTLSTADIEGMCDWVANRENVQDLQGHYDWHYGNHCPYNAVAEVLRGHPDPRRTVEP